MFFFHSDLFGRGRARCVRKAEDSVEQSDSIVLLRCRPNGERRPKPKRRGVNAWALVYDAHGCPRTNDPGQGLSRRLQTLEFGCGAIRRLDGWLEMHASSIEHGQSIWQAPGVCVGSHAGTIGRCACSGLGQRDRASMYTMAPGAVSGGALASAPRPRRRGCCP